MENVDTIVKIVSKMCEKNVSSGTAYIFFVCNKNIKKWLSLMRNKRTGI